jgi:hypothetical protein
VRKFSTVSSGKAILVNKESSLAKVFVQDSFENLSIRSDKDLEDIKENDSKI